MINVLHVTYDMRIGGTEMVIKNIIEGNKDEAINMSIFCIEAPLGPWGKELKAAGIPIATHKRRPKFDTKLIKAIRKHIKENSIDIVHCHQYTPWVYGALAAAFTKTKVIFTEHGRFYPDSSSWKRRIINPLLLQLTSKVTAISKATKQALTKYEYIPGKKVEVVYNGIAPLNVKTTKAQTRKKLSIPNDAFVFGTIARLDPIKNQTMMVKAFANATKSIENTFLVVVGDGEMRNPLELLVSELGISQKVIFTGYIPSPADLLNSFDVFLLSSLSEGTSMTLLEALSLGIPCIVTDAGGNAEVIKHGYNGMVVDNDNEQDFAKACASIMSADFDLYHSNCLNRFERMFTVTSMQKNFDRIWNTIKC